MTSPAPPPAATSGASRSGLLSWALYDAAHSAVPTLIQTFLFAAYFTRAVAENETLGTAYWGNTVGIAGLIVAIGGPVLGAIADQTGRRKPWIMTFTLLCVVTTALLWFIKPAEEYIWPALLLVGATTLAFEFAFIFYNAMLPGIVAPGRLGRWSGWGWAMGYAGSLLCLVIALLGLVSEDAWLALPRDEAQHVRATCILAAVWFLVFALPMFLKTPDRGAADKPPAQAMRDGLVQLRQSLRQVKRYRGIVRFLIARMFYADGLATLFAFGGVYAAGSFGMNEQQVLLFGILLNVTAGLGAAGFAWIDDWLGSKRTILLSLAGLIVTATLVLLVQSQLLFWVLGMTLGLFVGPAQAASRTYMGHAAPEALRTEMFGLLALSGKVTAFAGPLLVGWVTLLTQSQRIGMSTIVVFIAIGFVLMLRVPPAASSAGSSEQFRVTSS